MLIALLVVVGIDLVVVAAAAVPGLASRRWVKQQPGEFSGAVRVVRSCRGPASR